MAKSMLEMKELEELFDNKLKPIFSRFDHLNSKVDEAMNSLSFLSEKYDDLCRKVSGLEESNKELKEENIFLKNELSELRDERNELKAAQDELEQYTRRECLEIRGIPLTTGEDTNEIIVNLASKIGVEIKKEDISVSHRITSSRTNDSRMFEPVAPVIIAKFVRRDARDELYLARSKLKNTSTKDLGYTRFRESKIYIAESLTKKRKDLFKLSLRRKKELDYRYLWTRNGRILLRKDNDSPVIYIDNSQILERLHR